MLKIDTPRTSGNTMVTENTIRWVIAALFWFLALGVLYGNIKRQKINQARYDAGDDSRVSGVVFMFSIFAWIGAAASPMPFNAFWFLTLFGEIPGIGNFISYSEEAEELAKQKRAAVIAKLEKESDDYKQKEKMSDNEST